ncbi:gamma carbonic anhydrase family protein [Corynebacterium aurimucosum]|uniref:Gamma-type carbonic anhydratase-like protein n=1 Tax=Corynebacterium aurimucosum (strain ATCC 700975 / DSM 44827 / CIP 107346 / CN-1) TaxID=548476 RepID=C3PF57_CORA7|nr:gamma carbonic anhydrase family protein [Corynebacterium aurimucosum]ACP32461.1 gamma-type carbonic anhydratase-like protein [Corynebacterium aurimucosum ATCC 700975]QQU93358.1 gamma carbonic anhydrase family protein [Corynebacterium aurimucosum]
MLILPFQGHTPRIHRSAWIAPNATIIGDVTIGPDSSVFYGSVLRGDVGAIRLGARVNIQDNCVIHVEAAAPCVLEDDVTVGHMAMLHGTHVGAGALVGMKSSLLSGSTVGPGSLIAAGAVVLEGQDIPAGSLAAGVPAKVRRELSPEESAAFIPHAARYVDIAKDQAPLGDALSLDEVLYD